jgi:hypothetical protein
MLHELRGHPKLKYRGAASWPPAWGGSYGPDTVFPTDEDGVLKDVEIVEPDYIGPRRLNLLVEFHGEKHSAQLWIDDVSVVPKLYRVLREQAEKPLHDIGSLRVDL